jgi:SlyX protein
LNESVKRLEEKIAYLERHVAEQDKAMLEFADELAVLRRELKQLQLQLRAADGGGPSRAGDEADLPDERPPHY